MRKQTSIISFGGMVHNEIYADGHYHDAMYIGSQLVWQKINKVTPNRRFGIVYHGVYKNELYGLGYVMKENYQTIAKAICKYNFKEQFWEKVCTFSASWNPTVPSYPAWAEFGENGVYVQNGNEIARARPFFVTYSGQYYDLPTGSIAIKSKRNATNKGYLTVEYVSSLNAYQIVYKSFVSNTIIKAIPSADGFDYYDMTYSEAEDCYYAITRQGSSSKVLRIRIGENDSLLSHVMYEYSATSYPLKTFNRIKYDEIKQRVMLEGSTMLNYADSRSTIFAIDGTPLYTSSSNEGSKLYVVSGYNDSKTILYRNVDTYTANIKRDFSEPAIVVSNRTAGLPDMSTGMTLWTDEEDVEHLYWLNYEINSDGTMTNLNPDYNNMVE